MTGRIEWSEYTLDDENGDLIGMGHRGLTTGRVYDIEEAIEDWFVLRVRPRAIQSGVPVALQYREVGEYPSLDAAKAAAEQREAQR